MTTIELQNEMEGGWSSKCLWRSLETSSHFVVVGVVRQMHYVL